MSGVVLLAAPGPATNILYHALRPGSVILERPQSVAWLLRRRVKKLGWSTVLGQILFRIVVVPWLAFTSRRRVREIALTNGLDLSPIPEASIQRIQSVNSNEARALLRKLDPRVVVVSGTRIISRETLASLTVPFLNVHAGITPMYRGLHGGYWALASDDAEHCGVTVHVVDVGIDTGAIIAQAQVSPRPWDNFLTYPYLQIAAAIPLLKEAVLLAYSGQLRPQITPSGASRLWTHPTITQYLAALIARKVR